MGHDTLCQWFVGGSSFREQQVVSSLLSVATPYAICFSLASNDLDLCHTPTRRKLPFGVCMRAYDLAKCITGYGAK